MFQKLQNYIKSLNPAQTPPAIALRGDLLPIQEYILHVIFLCASLLSILTAALFLPGMLQSGNLGEAIFFTLVGSIFVVFALWRNAPYKLKAGVILFALYTMTVVIFHDFGFNGNASAILLTFIIYAFILFDVRIGLRAVVVGIITMAFFAFAFINELFPVPNAPAILDPTSPSDWLAFGFPLITLVGMTASAIVALLKRLVNNLSQARKLSVRLEEDQKKLDRLLREGSSRLKFRELQLQTASQISREFSTVLDSKILLNKVVNSVRENFDLYYVGIFLLDEEKGYAVLQAGTGEAGEKMLAANHRLEIGGASMIGWCISNREARISTDVGTERVRFNNPYLPETRSEMALPIVYQDHALGAITIQSVQGDAFVEEDIMILQGIADSLAIALENARLFQSTEQALEELRMYNQSYTQDTWGRTLATQGDLAFTYKNAELNTPAKKLHTINIPVNLREEKIGELNLETTSDVLDEDDRNFLDAVLTQTALALENARLIEETQRHAMQEQKLNDLSASLSKTSSIEYILQTAARELGQLPMVSEVSVQLVTENRETAGVNPGSNGNGKEH
jgi:GAF domain-containing protein